MKVKKNVPHNLRAISPRPNIRTVACQNHRINDNGMLDMVIPDGLNKKKKKKVYTQIDSYSHCQSLQKMQILTQQKNEDIKRFIYLNAELSGKNAQLKEMLNNPSFHEHYLHMTIQKMQTKIDQLVKELQQKDEEHRVEMQKVRGQYEMRISIMKDQIKKREKQSAEGFRFQQVVDGQRNILSNEYNQNGNRVKQNKSQTFIIGQSNKFDSKYQRQDINNNNNYFKTNEQNGNTKIYVTPFRDPSNTGVSNSQKDQAYTFGAPAYISYPQITKKNNSLSPQYRPEGITLAHSVNNQVIKSDNPQRNINKIYVYDRENAFKPKQINSNTGANLQNLKSPTELIQDSTFKNQKTDLIQNNSKVIKVVSKGTSSNLQTINYHSVYGKNDMDEIYKRYGISD